MKVFLKVLAVVVVLVVAFATCVFANRGEEKYMAEYKTTDGSPSPSLNAASSPIPSAAPSVTPSPSPTPINVPTDPLSGLPMDAKTAVNRPDAIMINNISVAQPQLGISKADIIYEILVEGGITRMMAIFQDVSNAGEIGSIRSARPYFVDIAVGYDAVYIHAGGSDDAYTELQLTGISHLDGVNGDKQDIFYRDQARLKKMGYEHSMVTTSDLINKYLPTYGIRLVHSDSYSSNMVFADSAAPAGGLTAGSVTVHFSTSKTTTFTYSPEERQYAVSQYKSAYIDGNDKSLIGVTNVLILKTNINVIAGDKAGRIDVDVTGSGTGTFINGGKYETINWSRKSNSDQFTYTRNDGSPLTLGRGKTYICIIDKTNTVDIK